MSTIINLYSTNVRSVLLYGIPLLNSIDELEKLDLKVRQQYFKKLLYTKRAVKNILYRLFIS